MSAFYVRSNIQPVCDGFPSHEMWKMIICNLWLYQTIAGHLRWPASADLSTAPMLQTCRPAQPSSLGLTAGGFSWAGYLCAVWKAKLKKNKTKQKEGCPAGSALIQAPEYHDQVIFPSAMPLHLTVASQHMLIQLCLLLHHLLIRNQLAAK